MKISFNKNSINLYFFLILIFFLSIFLRIGNDLSEGYWFDESLSFYLSNPDLTYKEFKFNYQNIIGGKEHNPVIYFWVLKLYFQVFGYITENGRIFSALFGSFSVFVSYFYFRLHDNKKSFFITILICFNIFLIWQSKEVRPASFVLFFSIFTNYIFITYLKKKNLINYLLLFFINILLLSIYPFTFLIVFSQYLTILINVKNFVKFIKISFFYLSIILIYIILNQDYLLNRFDNANSHWGNLELKFFINYFFRSFFGSITFGGLSLILFSLSIFSLIKKKKLLNNNFIAYNFIIIFSSYLFIILFTYFASGVAVPRYFIFIIPSIIFIITDFLSDKKKIFLNLYLFLTIINTLIMYNNFKIQKPPIDELVKILDTRSNNLYISDKKPLFKNTLVNNNYISSKYKFIKNTETVSNFWHVCLNNPRYAVNNNKNLMDEKSCQINVNNYKLMEVIKINDFKISLFQRNDNN